MLFTFLQAVISLSFFTMTTKHFIPRTGVLHLSVFLLLMVIIIIIIIIAPSVSASSSIMLNGSSEVRVNDAPLLDGFTSATWNIWLRQNQYVNNGGIISKYTARTGSRSYLIRTSSTNSLSIVLSQDGNLTRAYTSAVERACGLRDNNEWTMLSITYNGTTIRYFHNGKYCDTDSTLYSSLRNSNAPLRVGNGSGIYLKSAVDEFTMYNKALTSEQILRLYNESDYGTALGQSIPVLVYHQINTSNKELTIVTPDQFRNQMAYLSQNGFRTVSLRHYANWRKGTYTMPKKAVIIVFDDGFSSVYNIAKPIMDQYGFVGSVATVSNYATRGGPSTRYMNWTQIEDLSSDGWSIESHGMSHLHMSMLNESAFRTQLLDAKKNITTHTAKTPSSFVFPFHESNETYTRICGEYYSLCWTQGSMNPTYNFISTTGNEYLSLRRINVVNDTSMALFQSYFLRDTNKVGEWLMNEGRGNTTVDTSGKRYTGHLFGATWGSSTAAASENPTIVSASVNRDYTSPSDLQTDSVVSNPRDHARGHAPPALPDEVPIWPDNMPIEKE